MARHLLDSFRTSHPKSLPPAVLKGNEPYDDGPQATS